MTIQALFFEYLCMRLRRVFLTGLRMKLVKVDTFILDPHWSDFITSIGVRGYIYWSHTLRERIAVMAMAMKGDREGFMI